MHSYRFTLVVEGRDIQDSEVVDSLFESGCDGGTPSCSDGVQFVTFDRTADSLDEAILSAVEDMERVPGLRVVRVADTGLVSMADIAVRTGITRESARVADF